MDVAFDAGAARAAATRCRTVAATCDDVADGLVRQRDGATGDWEGRARDSFDRDEAVVVSELDQAREACLALAERIEQAIEDAAAEQQRREAAREVVREEERLRELDHRNRQQNIPR